VRGLNVRTSSSGEVSYWFRFRRHGELLSWTFKADGIAAARKIAEAARVRVANGEDPRRTRRGETTVMQAARLWILAKRRSWTRKTTRGNIGSLRLYVVPDYGDRPANSVTRGELAERLKRQASKHRVSANRTLALWRAMYRWLLEVEQEALGVTIDPTRGLKRPGGEERPRSRTYSDAEVARILAASKGDWGDYVRVLFHTATRAGETLRMRWADLDLERATWTIPAEHTKGRRGRVVPLSAGALAVLKARDPKRYADPRVFPFAHTSKPLTAIGEGAKLGAALRLHDIRRTVADRLRAQYGEALMHGVLGHGDAALTKTYGPTPRRAALAEALEWWSAELERIAKASVAASEAPHSA
jgi:integrase